MHGPEDQRLAALHQFEVLDTPREPLFDSLTQLAAQTFDAPIALITLLDDDRQWFKACVGLDIGETAREISFCQNTIQSDGVFIVHDALADGRFCDNPLVTGQPAIRFYAGAPLITPEGYRLGALCVIDHAPRAFGEADIVRLQSIARSVMQALVLRRDSRERERIAAVVAQQSKLLALAEEMCGVGTWSWRVAEDRTFWSDQIYRIHGFEPAAGPPRLQGVLDRYHPDDAKLLAHHIREAVLNGTDYTLKARIYRPDGEERHVVARGACRKDADGGISELIGTVQDITEHVAAERFIRNLADNLPGLVAYWDRALRCRFANAAYAEWFGRSPEQMRNLTLPELLGPKLCAANQQYIDAALDGERQVFPRTLVKPSGESCHTLAHYIPDIDATGRTQGFYVLVSDVTALKQAKDELKQANTLLEAARDQAQAAAAVKSEFLANMSHEIRTPLTAVLGYTSLLAKSDLSASASAQVERIAAAGRSLLSIVNDVLDFSELEAGHTNITLSPTAVAPLAREVLEMFSFQASTKGLCLEFSADPAFPEFLNVDPDRLRQILTNLISNGVKFTDYGLIAVGLSFDPAAEQLVMEVSDTGPGIPAQTHGELFQRFAQIDGRARRSGGGTGLGLAITKGLAEALGGSISLRSRPGLGSTFRLILPASLASAPLPHEVSNDPPTNLDGLRLLVIDDNAAIRDLVRAMLEPLGIRVSLAPDGEAGVAMAASRPFDVILMDMRMPGLDGTGAAAAIRQGAGPNRDAPMLVFSADDDGRMSQTTGALFTGRIRKPLAPAELLEALSHAARQGRYADVR